MEPVTEQLDVPAWARNDEQHPEREEEVAALLDRVEKVERERDELKARLAHAEADAEQAIHNEAFTERYKIAVWIRARAAHMALDKADLADTTNEAFYGVKGLRAEEICADARGKR